MYSEDGGKTWIKTDLDLAIEYIKSNGWLMIQSEFATKRNLRIEFDCYPFMISNGKCSKDWESLDELKTILLDKSFTGLL